MHVVQIQSNGEQRRLCTRTRMQISDLSLKCVSVTLLCFSCQTHRQSGEFLNLCVLVCTLMQKKLKNTSSVGKSEQRLMHEAESEQERLDVSCTDLGSDW